MQPLKFLQILLVALGLSAYSAWALHQRPGQPVQPDRAVAGIPLLRVEQAEALWQDRSTLFVDVRPLGDYEFGHIAGALHLPEPEFEQRFPALKERLERAKTIVVYCKSVDCGLSLWTAIRLRNAGLTQTMIYPEGWNEWDTRNLPS